MSCSSSAVARAREAARPYVYPEARAEGSREGPAGPALEECEQRAHQQGRSEGRSEAAETYSLALQSERAAVGEALREFARHREKYFQQVETEVVQLALAVARKILHREAQVDPMALAGIARITLDQLQAGTTVTVRVHPQQAAEWRHYFACQEDDRRLAEVKEDASVAVEGCVLETSVGSVELGFAVQFKEIETGLLDLLAQRPAGG